MLQRLRNIYPSDNWRNIALLAIGQGLFLISQTSMFFVGGLVGFSLAPDPKLATLPVTAVILGVALATIPASFFMKRVGRRVGFMTGTVFALFGASICAYAVWSAQFWLFCAGCLLVGGYNAFCLYYRFAAADSSAVDLKARGISLVLGGGIAAGFFGPQIALLGRDLVPAYTYMGSYLILAGLAVVAMLVNHFLTLPALSAEERRDPGRPILEIARQPTFMVAAAAALVAYGVMSLIMTATPLAMQACAFPDSDTGMVIQWHVLGMFGPSFFTGSLISRFGLYRIMFIGAGLLAACLASTIAGIGFMNFWLGLLLLGLGWNFMFVGATTLLTQCYRPAEQAKTQALNDFLIFASSATTSLLSGTLLDLVGWQALNWLAAPMVALAALLVIFAARMRQVEAH